MPCARGGAVQRGPTLTLTLTLNQVKSFDDFWERHCSKLGQVAFGSFITGAPYATVNVLKVSGAMVSVAVVRPAAVRLTMSMHQPLH